MEFKPQLQHQEEHKHHHQTMALSTAAKRAVVLSKHFPLNLTVQLPNLDESIHIETNTSLKIKQLKELIKVKPD